MPQFDVYPNPSRNTRNTYPYILDVQSPAISELATRIVIPLAKLEHFKKNKMTRLTLEVNYGGDTLLIMTPQIASMPAKALKNPVGSLSHLRDEILASIDFAITGV